MQNKLQSISVWLKIGFYLKPLLKVFISKFNTVFETIYEANRKLSLSSYVNQALLRNSMAESSNFKE
jgi:hypothetical protein